MELTGIRRPVFGHVREKSPLLRPYFLPFSVALLQCAAYVATALWKLSHFNVSSDFGMNNQATFLISHGVLNPFNTIGNDLMWQDQFKLLIWPIGLLRTVVPGAMLLVVLQATALALASGILVHTVQRLSVALPSTSAKVVIAITAAVILLEPWTFQAALADFHAQNIAAPALVLLISSILLHKSRFWMAGSAVIYLLSGSEACTVVAAAGLGFLLLRGFRREGAGLLALGSLWIALILVLHAAQGTPLGQVYGYLASSSHPTAQAILAGIIHHPGRPLSQLASHGITIVALLLMAGTIGLFYPPAGAVTCCEVLLAGLQQHTNLLDFASGSFQMWPAVALMLCGLPIVVSAVSQWGRRQHPRVQRLLIAGATLLGITTVIGNGYYDTTIPSRWNTVSTPVVFALQQASSHIPAGAEVIASNGIVGTFSARSYVYALTSLEERVPICSSTVAIVVVPHDGLKLLPSSTAHHVVTSTMSRAAVHTTVYGSVLTMIQLDVVHPGSSYLLLSARGIEIQSSKSPVACRNPLIS
ncbi:MAG: DUF2079 domain-containing protein [Candidatus Dormibacteria bacterium]